MKFPESPMLTNDRCKTFTPVETLHPSRRAVDLVARNRDPRLATELGHRHEPERRDGPTIPRHKPRRHVDSL